MLELSLYTEVAHVLSYDLCGIFKNTYFLIIPKIKQRFCVNKLAK